NMFSIDPWHPPTMLPGDEQFSATRIFKEFENGKIAVKILSVCLLPLIYIPALLYRWSIKSTFWFYWPLLYIQSGRFKQVIDSATFHGLIQQHPMERLRLLLAVVTLAVLGVVSFSQHSFIDIQSTNPVMLFPYLLAIDIFAIKPWQWLQLATAILTFALWAKAWTISIAAQTAKDHGVDYDWSKVEWLRKLARVRNLTTWFYLAIGLVFLVLYLGAYQELPVSWVQWLSDFFDTPLPVNVDLPNSGAQSL
ncbi:MAG: hypothetical protein ACI8WB_001170, partial [Phenylobacterium sp.]